MRVPKDRACQGGVESESGKSLRGPPASTMSGYISRAAPRLRDMPSFKVSLILIGNQNKASLKFNFARARHLGSLPLGHVASLRVARGFGSQRPDAAFFCGQRWHDTSCGVMVDQDLQTWSRCSRQRRVQPKPM